MGVTKIRTRTRDSLGVSKQAPGPVLDDRLRILPGEYNNAADDIIEMQDAIGVDDAPAHGSLEYRARLPTIESVIASPGKPSQFVKTSGWADQGDNAVPVEVYWSTTEGTVDDVDIFANFSGQGSWRRVKRTNAPLIRSWKIFGVSDDTAAFENLCKKQFKGHGGRFNLSEYNDKVILTETVTLSAANGIERGWEIVGAHNRDTTGSVALGGPFIEWQGNDSTPVFGLQRQGCIRGIKFRPGTGKPIHTVLEIQNPEWEYIFSFLALIPTNSGSEPILNGIRVLSGIASNVDRVLVEHSYFMTKEIGIDIAGGQPYNFQCRRVDFASSGSQTGVHSGVGVRLATPSVSLKLDGCSFGKLSIGVGLPLSAHAPVEVNFADAEHTKRFLGLWDGSVSSGNSNFGSKVSIRSARLTQHTTAKSAASESPAIASGDNVYMHFPYAGPVVLDSVECSREGGGGHDPDLHILLEGSSSFVARASRFWNSRPFRLRGEAASRGHWTIENCEGVLASPDANGRVYTILDSRSGTRATDHGSTVVSGDTDSVSIGWDHGRQEFDAPHVYVSVTPESGTPASGSVDAEVSDVSKYGCLVTLGTKASPVAPGSGNSVRVQWSIRPRRTVTAVVGETSFVGSSTVRGTAADAGFDQPRWIAVLARLNGLPSVNEALWSRYDGTDGYYVEVNASGSYVRMRCFGSGTAGGAGMSFSASDVGRTYLWLWSWDGSLIRSFSGRSEQGSGVSSGYVTGGASVRSLLGTDHSGAQPCTSLTILGVAGSDSGSSPLLADVQDYCDAIERAGTLVAFPGSITTEHLWLTNSGSGTITDDVGADDITLVSGTSPKTMAVVPAFRFATTGGLV